MNRSTLKLSGVSDATTSCGYVAKPFGFAALDDFRREQGDPAGGGYDAI